MLKHNVKQNPLPSGMGSINILVIHEVDWIRKVVFDVHWIAESMSLLGHQVYVITYESLWRQDKVKLSDREFVVSRAYSGSAVHLIHSKFIRIPVLSRVSASISHYFEIKRVIKEKKIDAIVLYSVPTNGLQTVHWAKRFKIPVVFRSIDVLNQLVPYSFLRPVTKLLEKKVYSNVDMILTITPKLSEYVVKLGANPNKVGILPIPVDTKLFHPLNNVDGLRQRWGLEGSKIVLFMGTLYNFSGLDVFIARFLRVVERIPEAKLLIVGDGEQRSHLEGLIDLLGLRNNVIITGFQPYQDIPQYINLAEICINPFIINNTTKDIFPGKTVQYLACGKPLVMTPMEGVKALISGEEQGVVYTDHNFPIAEAVISLLKSDERRKRIGQNGLRYVREHHDYMQVAKQLEVILLDLIKIKNDGK